MKVYKETKRLYHLKNEFDEAATYTLVIHQSGNYYIEMFGGGGGSASHIYTSASATNVLDMCSGGSGAGFKGVVTLVQGSYNITVGSAGTFGPYNSSTSEGGTGGTTTLQGIISVGGGTGGYCRGSASGISERIAGVGGTVQILDNSKIVSSSLSSSGNNGEVVRASTSTTVAEGGVSVSNNNNSGYGAGGSRLRAEISNDVCPAQAGYFRIERIASADDYNTYEDIDIYKVIRNNAVYTNNMTLDSGKVIQFENGIAYGYSNYANLYQPAATVGDETKKLANEFYAKFKFNTLIGVRVNMFFAGGLENSYGYANGTYITIGDNGKFGIKKYEATTTGQTLAGEVISNYTAQTGVWYWLKMQLKENKIVLLLSTDDINYFEIINTQLEPLDDAFNYYTIFSGSIDAYFDLTQCYKSDFRCCTVSADYKAINL